MTWEAWEFTVEGLHKVEVTNASYGFEKDDHSYIVGVKERDGQVIPAECGCEADRYGEDYDLQTEGCISFYRPLCHSTSRY